MTLDDFGRLPRSNRKSKKKFNVKSIMQSVHVCAVTLVDLRAVVDMNMTAHGLGYPSSNS